MNSGRKIVPLQFSYWYRLSESAGEYYQQLPGAMGLKIDPARQQEIHNRLKSEICPCCGGELLQVESITFPDETRSSITYLACDGCGFFKYELWDKMGGHDFELPFVKEFDARNEVPSLSQLSRVIHDNHDRLYLMAPSRFEIFVGSILRDFYECEVRHVGRSGDDGIDLVVILGENPIMVQVKRRENPASIEGIEVVKLLFASAFGQGANAGMVVTTAQRFSRPARSWIDNSRLRDVRFQMQLMDVNSLMSMVNAIRSKNAPLPWEAHRSRLRDNVSNSQLENWRHISLIDGDILLNLSNKDWSSALVWWHNMLDSCYQVVAPTKKLYHIQPDQLSFDMFLRYCDNHVLPIMQLAEDQCFVQVAAIPEKALETLISRWSSRFPDVVIDLANY